MTKFQYNFYSSDILYKVIWSLKDNTNIAKTCFDLNTNMNMFYTCPDENMKACESMVKIHDKQENKKKKKGYEGCMKFSNNQPLCCWWLNWPIQNNAKMLKNH